MVQDAEGRRALLVTSDSDVLDTMKRALNGGDFTVVGEAWPGIEAVQRAGELKPDVVLLHSLHGAGGYFDLAALPALARGRPGLVDLAGAGAGRDRLLVFFLAALFVGRSINSVGVMRTLHGGK